MAHRPGDRPHRALGAGRRPGPDPGRGIDPAAPGALLESPDKDLYTHHAGPRLHAAVGRTEQHFGGYDGEWLHGLGRHLRGCLDQEGWVIDLVQGNTVAAIPFLHCSRGYGLLWNNPATGRVELGAGNTRWTADTYAAATEGLPLLPDALGPEEMELRERLQGQPHSNVTGRRG